MFKHRKKATKSNKEVIIEGTVRYECGRRGINIDTLNLTKEQMEELYRQFTEQLYRRRDSDEEN